MHSGKNYFIENKDEPKEIGDLVYNVLPASITNALSVAVNTDIPALPLLQDAIYYAMQKTSLYTNSYMIFRAIISGLEALKRAVRLSMMPCLYSLRMLVSIAIILSLVEE